MLPCHEILSPRSLHFESGLVLILLFETLCGLRNCIKACLIDMDICLGGNAMDIGGLLSRVLYHSDHYKVEARAIEETATTVRCVNVGVDNTSVYS